jgi:Xylanase inhibitor N-terminal
MTLHRRLYSRFCLSLYVVLLPVLLLPNLHRSLAQIPPEIKGKRILKRVKRSLETRIPEAAVQAPLHAYSGTHHIVLWIGQPPQKQTLIVDTGSRLTATACAPCKDCGSKKDIQHHVNPLFDPQESSTFFIHSCQECHWTNTSKCNKRQCEINQKYTEGSSWTAVEVNDFVFVGDNTTESVQDFIMHTVPFTFGCQSSVQGLFRKQYANGILGLERSPFSLVHRMYYEQVIPFNAFSLCHTSTAGLLGFGGPFWSRHSEQMKFTPLVAVEGGWYSVHVVSLYLGDHCITCKAKPDQRWDPVQSFHDGRGTILDSGTTDTYLPGDLSDVFEKAWQELTGVRFAEQTHGYTFDEFTNLPWIYIHLLNNVTISIEPEHYMEGVVSMEPWSGKRELTNRVYLDEPGGAVLGLNAMMDYDILFDASNDRIGIARAECDRSSKAVTAGAGAGAVTVAK